MANRAVIFNISKIYSNKPMTSNEFLTLVILLSPGMLLSIVIMLTFSKGG